MTVIIDGTAGITFPNSTTQAVAGAPLTTPSFTTTIGVGAATASASGAGITFPATQSASSDANTLDDYEEGTWTPTVTAQSGSITSYSITGARYTKVGNIVRASLYINMTNSGTASGTASVTLPFSPVDTNWAGCGGEVGAVGFSLNVFGSAGGMSFRKYENSTAFGTNYGYLLTAIFQV